MSLETARLCLVWLTVGLLIHLVIFHTLSLNTTFPPLPKGITMPLKRLFPPQRFKLHHWKIKRVSLEQSGLPNSAMVQVYHQLKHTHELWYLLPFSVSPPPRLIYSSLHTFNWVVNADMNILMIGERACELHLWERTKMDKGTMGSWHHRQRLRLRQPVGGIGNTENTENTENTGNDASSGSDPCDVSLTLSPNGERAVVTNRFSVYYLKLLQRSPIHFRYQRLRLEQTRLKFQTFPQGLLHLSQNVCKWLTAYPEYKQTDGLVDIYTFDPESPKKATLWQTLQPPVRASGFGEHCSWVRSNKQGPALLISARFAPYAQRWGAGAVYVYGWDARADIPCLALRQTLQAFDAIDFGKVFAVSDNGNWLVVSGRDKVWVYWWLQCKGRYGLQNMLTRHTPQSQNFGASLSVDNQGTLLLSDDHQVYFTFMHKWSRQDQEIETKAPSLETKPFSVGGKNLTPRKPRRLTPRQSLSGRRRSRSAQHTNHPSKSHRRRKTEMPHGWSSKFRLEN